MLCKTLRSEYMKRFKDPHWEAYKSCYEEMLKYRLTRRLLEQAHNPWLWEGWDRSSDSSSGQTTPPPPKTCESVAATSEASEPAPPAQKLAAADHEKDADAITRQNGICEQITHNEVPSSGSDPLRQAVQNRVFRAFVIDDLSSG
ncbi:hypothetical protein GDO78_016446 [Eleutherodactylus coqui]|uniref:Centriole, cilia and spindle-associated protein n=1 Tax=Eleutherodactylus coqui TaxID=57060 RepID=A0A8J6BK19_ELECQ|nr:hypothetical protein GDO78_016446 [Eleutherodactylus coqui]